MKTILALFFFFSLFLSCSQKKKESDIAKQEFLIEGNADTIKKDYYSNLIIYENIEPKGKNPSGKNYNEQIYKSFYIENPTLEKLKEIFSFYKLFYSKRAKDINNELTINLWFFDMKVPYADANPKNLDSDPKYDKNIACTFIYNYKNGYNGENCSTYEKFNKYFYENKKL